MHGLPVYKNIQLLARVIFTPLEAFEMRNYEVDTTMLAKNYNPYQLNLHYILVTVIQIFSKSQIWEF